MKKKCLIQIFYGKDPSKILLTMKLIILLSFFTAIQMNASVFSQNGKISVNLNNSAIKDVFDVIENEFGYKFIYSDDLVDANERVSIDVDKKNIEEVIQLVLNKSIYSFKVLEDRLVVIYPSKLEEQGIIIKGKVTDSNGSPLPGVNIVEKGTTNGAVTDLDGNYSISVSSTDAILTFSFVGFLSEDISVNSQTTIDIALIEDITSLEEVVVVGYGVAKKSDLTGSITQVKADEMKKFSPSNVSDILRASVPGLNVGYAISAKGNSSFGIRGETTLTAGASPLIVLDGVIYNGDISDINPDDIDRIDVLKDASSAAVYGSRATNGVIVITTKRGESEVPTITFNGSVGLATTANRLKPYDADGFIQWRSDMFKSVYSATVPSDQWSPFDDPRTIDQQYLNDWLAYHSTTEENMVDAWLSGLRLTGIEMENYKAGLSREWEDDIYQNGIRQDYNVSLSGKRENYAYYWSLGYMDNEGLTIGDEFSTIRSRVNIEGDATDFLKVGLNAQFAYSDESSVPADNAQYQNLTPFSSYFAEDGKSLRLYPNDDIMAKHPLLDRTYRTRERQEYTLFPKIYSILELPFGITYTMNFTTRLEFYHNYVHNSSEHPLWGLYGGEALRDNALRREWQIDNILSWKKTLNDIHRFDVTLLANAEKFRIDSDGLSNQTFSPSDILGYHNMTAGALPELSSADQVRTADALMARLNYVFNNKYMITMSARRDGSSLFGYSNPRATFPAAALGWVISEENWFGTNAIDYLKIRASWGINGNRSIDNYAALSKIASAKTINASQNGASIVIPTLEINSMSNKELRWEKTEAYNLGIDFKFLEGVVSGTIDAYKMSTTDVLVNRSLPTITGFERVYANLGEVKNKGVELMLDSRNMERTNFSWRTNVIFSINRNEIVSITGEKFDVLDANGNVTGQKEADDKTNNWFIGEAKDVIWDYKILGTWKVGEEEAAEWGQSAGDFRLEDVNNDGLLTDDDKQFLGYTEPRFRWTMTNSFSFYKNFEASIVMYSLLGMKSSFELAKHDNHIEDRRNTWDIPYWTPENQTDDFARLRSAPANGVNYNTWFDRSFIRVEHVALAYRLPQNILNKSFIQSLKVSFSIRNAALWTPEWDFGDPEDQTRTPRIYSIGFNMTL